jgi:hypothetical protein
MTVATSLNKIQYSGTGVRTTFPYNFKIFEDEDLVVILTAVDGTDTTWTLNTHYTVTGAGNIQGGNVVVKTSPVDYTPADGTKLTIVRIVDITQESDYVENAPFHAETLEDDFDKGTMIDQQLSEQWGRAITVAVTDVDADLELPNATTRANTFLTFGPSGEVDVSSLADIDLIDPGTAGRVVIYKTEHRLEQSAVSISNGVVTASGGNSNQWNTAYGWGDHSTEGYITHDEVNTISGALNDKIEALEVKAVEEFTLTSTNISNKYVELSNNPSTNEVIAWVDGGTHGLYDTDYVIANDNQVSWNSKNWESILEEGDVLTVLYWY